MDKKDSYLLLLIGILVIAVMAVEMIPIPMMDTYVVEETTSLAKPYFAGTLNSGSVSQVIVLPTSSLATVTVTGGE